MRFGTYYFLQAPPGSSHEEVIHREFAQILLSEELGYDSVWLTEHHFIEYGISTSPMALAAAIAARTERVAIGLAAVILPFHDPIRLAEEIAFVDILSRGRLRVGIGRGNRPVEFVGYRVPQIESRERFGETVDIMLQAWTQERVSYHGKFFSIEDIPVIPKPHQKPHPPLSLVCVSPETMRMAAQRGWSMLNSILFGPFSQIEQNRDIYTAALSEAGHSEAAIRTALQSWGVSRHIYVAPTDAQALRDWPKRRSCGINNPWPAFLFPSISRPLPPPCNHSFALWPIVWPPLPGSSLWQRPYCSARRSGLWTGCVKWKRPGWENCCAG